MTPYSIGTWVVLPGHEEAFIAAWCRLAKRTSIDFPGAHGTLVRDLEDPLRFISMGAWNDPAEIAAWRESDTFRRGVAEIDEHVQSFVPGTYRLVADSAELR